MCSEQTNSLPASSMPSTDSDYYFLEDGIEGEGPPTIMYNMSSTNVSVSRGGRAHLHCTIHNALRKTVVWTLDILSITTKNGRYRGCGLRTCPTLAFWRLGSLFSARTGELWWTLRQLPSSGLSLLWYGPRTIQTGFGIQWVSFSISDGCSWGLRLVWMPGEHGTAHQPPGLP